MLQRITFLLMLMIGIGATAQQYAIGTVLNDAGKGVPGVAVFNLRTNEAAWTNTEGQFVLRAEASDRLRFARQGYDRAEIALAAQDFSRPVSVVLQLTAREIPEVALGFRATGNLKRDVKSLDASPKVAALNSDMRAGMRQLPANTLPQNTTPSAFAQRNFSAGQVDVFALAKRALSLLKKAKDGPQTTANYAERQAFYRLVKNTVDMAYFQKIGWDEYQFEKYLVYVDDNFGLSKKYRNNYDKVAVENILKSALKKYLEAGLG